MKRLVLILTPILLLAGAVTAVVVAGQARHEWTDEELARYAEDLKAAIEKRDFGGVWPVVRVTHRPVEDPWKDPTRPAWINSIRRALSMMLASDAVDLRDAFIESIIEDAAALGEDGHGLKLFFSGAFAKWSPLRPGHRLAALPCTAELVAFRGRPTWVVWVNWSACPKYPVLNAHIAVFAIDPESGEILVHRRCA